MRSIIIALLAAGLISAPASAQSFVGEWIASAQTPDGGVIQERLSVKKAGEGYSIEAQLVEPPPEGTPQGGPGFDIVLDGDTFSYKRTVALPAADVEIVYKGVVSGDTFTGTGEIGGFSVPYNGERVTEGS
jgi:hypothetical protein